MKTVWTIVRRELRSLFDHPTGYILLIVFLAFNDFLFFRQAYLMGVASLRPMLQLLPWLLLFFIPAVTMRSLAEDGVELSAVCMVCHKDAHFSKRISEETALIVEGGADKYMAVCRTCWHK